MGLFSGLLLLPLAPVRGTVWIAEKLQEQAELEMNDETAIRQGLIDLEAARASGDYDEADLVEAENELLERLMLIRGYQKGARNDGGLE